MLSEDKIRLMIRLSEYEQGQGKRDLHRTSYYRSDYVRLQILKTIVAVLISVALSIILVVMYDAEYIIDNVMTLDYLRIGFALLALVVLLCVIMSIIMIRVSGKTYDESKDRVKVYYHSLNQLLDYYDQEEKEE